MSTSGLQCPDVVYIVTNMAKCGGKDRVFDELLSFLGDNIFQIPVRSFMDENSLSKYFYLSICHVVLGLLQCYWHLCYHTWATQLDKRLYGFPGWTFWGEQLDRCFPDSGKTLQVVDVVKTVELKVVHATNSSEPNSNSLLYLQSVQWTHDVIIRSVLISKQCYFDVSSSVLWSIMSGGR